MNYKNKKTIEALFQTPTRADIAWRDIEVLVYALGGNIKQGNGSRVRITLKSMRLCVHIPHPQKEISKGLVKVLCKLLKKVEIYTHDL